MSKNEWVNLGFIIHKMPPRKKLLNDLRERECKDQVKEAQHVQPHKRSMA